MRRFLGAIAIACATMAIFPSEGRAAQILVGSWSGNGTAADASGFGNNGTFAGSYATGPTSGTQAFNLATGTVSIPASGLFALGNNYTVSFSFNFGVDQGNDVSFLGQTVGFGGPAEVVDPVFCGL